MKDEQKRRRKLERALIRTLSDVDSCAVFTSVHQESLDIDCREAFSIAAQGQEFLVSSSTEWWVVVYGLSNEDSTASFDLDSVSEISDDAVIPQKTRKALWRAFPRDPEPSELGNVAFLAPDVLGLVQPETRSVAMSTWNVRSGEYLESIVLRGEYSCQTVCKISDTQFVVGCSDGHLFSFEHEGGCNLRETGRVWKAHATCIWSISFHNGVIVTTSRDWTARLWDAETNKRLATLQHNNEVLGVALSDQHIVTSSQYGPSYWEHSELRIYRNIEGYPLTKILRSRQAIHMPTLLEDGRVLCVLRRYAAENGLRLVRNALVVVDFENERALAQLKVGCRNIAKYEVLADGRVVVIGREGCRGVIATLPREFTRLISSKTTEKRPETGRRRMCTLI